VTVNLQIDGDSIRASGRSLSSAADRFVAALNEFAGTLAGFGEPWGNDDIGSLIGAAYAEVYDWAMECYTDALDELGAMGNDLDGMAQAHEDADGRSALVFRRLSEGMGA
jgi:hypothetical protein